MRRAVSEDHVPHGRFRQGKLCRLGRAAAVRRKQTKGVSPSRRLTVHKGKKGIDGPQASSSVQAHRISPLVPPNPLLVPPIHVVVAPTRHPAPARVFPLAREAKEHARRLRHETGFIGTNGPLYFLHEGPKFRLGFRVEPRHCNPMGICHGGMLATFADMLMPIGAISLVPEVQQRFLPTVSLQIDFIGPAKIGDWVEGEMQVLRTTRTLVFAQGLVRSNGVLSMRCSGVFRIGPEFDRPLPE